MEVHAEARVRHNLDVHLARETTRWNDQDGPWDGFLHAHDVRSAMPCTCDGENEGEQHVDRRRARRAVDALQGKHTGTVPSQAKHETKQDVEEKEHVHRRTETHRVVEKDAIHVLSDEEFGGSQLDDEVLATIDLESLVQGHQARRKENQAMQPSMPNVKTDANRTQGIPEETKNAVVPTVTTARHGIHRYRDIVEELLQVTEKLAFETHTHVEKERLVQRHRQLKAEKEKLPPLDAMEPMQRCDPATHAGNQAVPWTGDTNRFPPTTVNVETGQMHAPSMDGGFAAPSGLPPMDLGIHPLMHERPKLQAVDIGPVSCRRTEGSTDRLWKRKDFDWSQEIVRHNKSYFGNDGFRINQLEAINATMSKRDCFVLMPTGGGKSLCFQLPALCGGVTVVISPLVSLIEDQISQLRIIDVPCAYLSASMDYVEQRSIMDDLRSPQPSIKLLYVTPEKVVQSNAFQSALQRLNENNHLARIVIDEAHCVSQWGHDFRPDYKGLWIFKSNFNNVPIMALTATATPRVQEDVVLQLRLEQCVTFRSSFNRPNLRYEVRPKKAKAVVEQMKSMIETHYIDKFGNVMSGIIYCLSRGECEKLSNQLSKTMLEYRGRDGQVRKKRLIVGYYHAGLTHNQRKEVQRRWSNDEIPIICATIAFGMGINKPDVRFVIHYSMPKSLEGYHQEAGRAGRDGQISACILLYSYADAQKAKHMIKQSAIEQRTAPEHLRLTLENLDRMIAYCEEKVECRRVLQLSHFGETSFTAAQCNKTCDNCWQASKYTDVDMTRQACELIDLVGAMQGKSSLSYVVDVFRGSKSAQVKMMRHEDLPQYGKGKGMKKSEVERILRRMILENILVEESHRADNQYQNVITSLRVNQGRAGDYLHGRRRLMLKCLAAEKPGGGEKKRSRDVIDVTDEYCTTVPGDELGVEIYEELMRAREEIVKMPGNEKAETILTKAVLERISQLKPTTEGDLRKIPSLVQSHIQKFGSVLIQAVTQVIQRRQQGGGWVTAGGKRDLSSFAYQGTGNNS